MGLGNLLRRIWRFFHPQWTAMTPRQIKEIDRAVAESMAKGSFTTKHRPAAAQPTADQLWTGTTDTTTTGMGIGRAMSDYSGSSSYYAGGGGSGSNYDEYIPPPIPSEPVRLWSMASSRGGVSVSSSRGRDSGYAEQQFHHQQQYQRPSSSATRKYTPSPQLYHRPSYYNNHQQYQQQQQQQQQWGYNEPEQPYYYDEQQLQYSRPQYPPASYYPEGGYARAYVPPVGDDDGIVAGEPVNAPF